MSFLICNASSCKGDTERNSLTQNKSYSCRASNLVDLLHEYKYKHKHEVMIIISEPDVVGLTLGRSSFSVQHIQLARESTTGYRDEHRYCFQLFLSYVIFLDPNKTFNIGSKLRELVETNEILRNSGELQSSD